MFVVNEKDQGVPIKIWLRDESEVEESWMDQAKSVSRLPFVFRHIALMPDVHAGYGLPIGGVAAFEDVLSPFSIGYDIGCGMRFVETNVDVNVVREEELRNIVERIVSKVPVGMSNHSVKQTSEVLDSLYRNDIDVSEFKEEVENAYYQIKTVGSNNHFIELQKDNRGKLCIMVHTGSRNFGYRIADKYIKKAEEKNKMWYSNVPKGLNFLPVNSKEGEEYLFWMRVALNWAKENREKIMNVVKNELEEMYGDVFFGEDIDVHHNYASLENHFNKNVWVHRKGAVCVRKGMYGLIPGAMGAESYVVKGIGNKESFHSCSHGAGRTMSRRKAEEILDEEEVLEDLNKKGLVTNKREENIVSESRFSYKDINEVIENQVDLVEPVKKLTSIATIKKVEGKKKKKK